MPPLLTTARQGGRIKDRRRYWEQSSDLPDVHLLDCAGPGQYTSRIIYANAIDESEKRIVAKQAAKYGAAGPPTSSDRQISKQEFAKLLPSYRRWYGEDDEPAADAIVFSNDWPARWRIPEAMFDGDNGHIDKPDVPEPEPTLPSYVRWRRRNPDAQTLIDIAQEWLSDLPSPTTAGRELAEAVHAGQPTRSIIRAIRKETGYAGNSKMLTHAITGKHPRDAVVRIWLFGIQPNTACLVCGHRERPPAALACLICDPTPLSEVR